MNYSINTTNSTNSTNTNSTQDYLTIICNYILYSLTSFWSPIVERDSSFFKKKFGDSKEDEIQENIQNLYSLLLDLILNKQLRQYFHVDNYAYISTQFTKFEELISIIKFQCADSRIRTAYLLQLRQIKSEYKNSNKNEYSIFQNITHFIVSCIEDSSIFFKQSILYDFLLMCVKKYLAKDHEGNLISTIHVNELLRLYKMNLTEYQTYLHEMYNKLIEDSKTFYMFYSDYRELEDHIDIIFLESLEKLIYGDVLGIKDSLFGSEIEHLNFHETLPLRKVFNENSCLDDIYSTLAYIPYSPRKK